MLGAMAGGGLALAFPDTQGAWLLPAMFVAGALGGMAWAALPAFLKVRFNTNEILTTLMLTYVAGLLLSYMVYGPWRAESGYGWPESEPLQAAARLPRLLDGTRLNPGILLALAVAGAGWLFVARSFLAYRMEVGGMAAGAARYAGFGRGGMVWVGLLAGGACAGSRGSSRWRGPSASCARRSRPATGLRRSSSPSSAACIRAESCSRAC